MNSRKRLDNSVPPPPSVVDQLTGIVHSVFPVEMYRRDPDVFVVAAEAAPARASGPFRGFVSEGSGAGMTHQSAWWAAVGETVERYALGIMSPEDLLFGSCAELRRLGQDPIDPHDCTLFHPSQQDKIPFTSFATETPIAWVSADSLTLRRSRLVPACLVFLPYQLSFQAQGEQVIAPSISTGAVCARSRAEALLKGICEHIERDSFMIMWRNRLRCPRVRIDPGSVLHGVFRERFERPGLFYTLVYTTLDLAIPSFCGILIDARRDPPGLVVGGAAHPDPIQAAEKTLLELVQGLKWRDHEISRGVTLPEELKFEQVRSFQDRARLYAFRDLREAFRFLWDDPREVALSEISTLDRGSVRQNLQLCIGSLAERGLEILAADLTPVDVQACGLCVIRVLVPGAEVMEGDHMLPQLGGQRWRDVPFQLGLLPARPGIDTLNPFPHPYP